MPSRQTPSTTTARLHKRAHSASAAATTLCSPLSPVADYDAAFRFDRADGADTPTGYGGESWRETTRPMPAAASSSSHTHAHPLKIKPYLRKLSSKDSSGLDLSRPAAENDLAGLGISDYGGYPRSSLSDVTFTPVNGRHRHHRHDRSSSNTSQFSTSSGLQRPTPLPAVRPTPQPYSPPPILQQAKSSPPSVLGSENENENEGEGEGDDIMGDAARRSGSLSSAQGTSLRIHTNTSSTRLAGSYSQSSVSLTSPIVAPVRARGDTLKSADTATSPSSRTSLDQTYRFIRGGRDSPVDAAARAASIRAARLKFEEEQRAKARKYEKVAHKQQERDYRKQLKKEDHQRRRSETLDRAEVKRSRTLSDDCERTPRPSVGGRQYSDHREAHSHSLPKLVTTVDPEKAISASAAPKVTKSRAAKGRWLRFITWFRTRLLRMSGK
ncbi:hypothetical protein BDW02DRAFT_59952 [Decorospora gaudefroyi]|uniref:Uncharacterized protein n=1 Tax=Decorospora gaudefroyi TaxID=184978 RepID=A0A6A5K2A3_9PLEO|nr:hypothetical protein BDW02DRAFT_59952 [Decorospora gaudefroyi]